MPESLAKKVLLIGWDAADWRHINPLLEQGLLPTIEEFVNEGVMGNIATLQPVLSPMLWNSIATGMRPQKHGILGFTEPAPDGAGIRPFTSTSRKVKAIWNILTQKGYKTHVVTWFAGHPVEPINGVCVSPHIVHPAGPKDKPWPMPPKSVHPEDLIETFADLRIHPQELGAGELLPFASRAAEVDQEKDKRPGILAKLIAETATVHNAATWIMQNREWDFLAVYFTGIDHFCHAFMQYHPPRMESVDEESFEIYQHVVAGAYRFHDMLLHTLLQLAGPDTTVVLVSDHGFHSDHLRPLRTPKVPAGPAIWHRDLGIFAMKGPHVKVDERVYGATLLDVTPTILTLFGLPVGEDMDGKPLVQSFDKPVELARIPSWEEVPGECGAHPEGERLDPVESQAAIDQMVALGYIEKPDADKQKAIATAVREINYNLARDYMDARSPAKALPLLEELVEENPADRRYAQHLAQCQLELGNVAAARTTMERLLKDAPTGPWSDLLMGIVEYQEGNISGALERFERAEANDPRLPALHQRLGNLYLRLRRWKDAQRAFHKALEIDDDCPRSRLGLAIVALRERRPRDAAAEALAAVGIQHFLPQGHFFLGVALTRVGDRERARLALETAVAMAPGLLVARRYLAALYRRQGDLDKFAEHRTRAAEIRLSRQQRRK